MSQIPWLTVREVADQLQVTEETVRRWIRRGELGAIELGGPRTVYRIRSEDLDHFMWQRYRRPREDPPAAPVESLAPDFQQLIERVPVVTFIYDPGREGPSRVTYISPEIEDLLGVPRDEWYRDLWSVWQELILLEDREESLRRREEARKQWLSNQIPDDHFTTEFRLRSRSGQIAWLSADMEVVRSPTGQPLYWSGVLVDITDRKHIEEQLQHRIRRERRLQSFSHLAIEEESLDTLLNHAVREVTEELRVEYARVFELMPGSDYLRLRAGIGWAPGRIGVEEVPLTRGGRGPVEVRAFGEGQAAYTLAAGTPVISPDFSREDRFSGEVMMREYRVRSGVGIIIPGKARPYGVLSVTSVSPREYPDEDVSFIQAVANTLAMAASRTDERWLTIPEVAGILQVNVETVRRWIRSGALSAVLLGGSRTGYRIHSSDLEKFTRHRPV